MSKGDHAAKLVDWVDYGKSCLMSKQDNS